MANFNQNDSYYENQREWRQDKFRRHNLPADPFSRLPKCLTEPPKPFKLDKSLFVHTKPSPAREYVRASQRQRKENDDGEEL
jgi:hypothetical protein